MSGRHWKASHKDFVQSGGWTPDLQITSSAFYRSAMSTLAMATERKKLKELLKNLLLQSYMYWPDSYGTLCTASVWYWEQLIQKKRNFDFINVLVSMATEWKNLNKYLKIFFSKTTRQILMKLHKKHQCDMGSKRYRTEFWFHHYSGCHCNRKKRN